MFGQFLMYMQLFNVKEDSYEQLKLVGAVPLYSKAISLKVPDTLKYVYTSRDN